MNKHTPGPWIARNLSKGIWTVEAGSPHVHGKIQEVCRIAGPWNPENYRRNARLIASAPTMLSVLERVSEWLKQHGTPENQGIACDVFQAIDAAKGNP